MTLRICRNRTSAPRILILPTIGLVALLVGSFASVLAQEIPPAQRPNILVIVSDDQGFGDLSALGHPVLKTPHLDRLKSESLWMRRFYTSPLCAPTRAQIMTGRHQFRTGVWDTWSSRSNLAADEKTAPQYFREAGYRTGIFGKWHLGENYPFRPQDRGFDETLVWSNFDRMAPTFSRSGATVGPFDRFLDDMNVDEAIRFLGARQDQPFFLYVPLWLPHDHWQEEVPAQYIEPYRHVASLTDKEKRIFGMIGNLDYNVGRLLDALDKAGLREDTLVIFMSDNGLTGRSSALGSYNAGLRGRKGQTYEGGIRVPFFVRWPARIAPRVEETPAMAADLLPTLLEAATGRAPQWKNPIDGLSLLGLWERQTNHLPDRTIIQQQQPQRTGKSPQPFDNVAVIGPRYKLVVPAASSPKELYDLSVDEGERTDVAAQHPEVVKQLSDHYLLWLESMNSDRGFASNPAILGNPASDVFRESMIQVQETNGLSLIVEKAGQYEVELLVVRQELFPEGGELGLSDGQGKVWKAPVRPETESVKLVLELAAGPLRLFAWNRGKLPKSGYVPLGDDPGFRQIVIRGPLH